MAGDGREADGFPSLDISRKALSARARFARPSIRRARVNAALLSATSRLDSSSAEHHWHGLTGLSDGAGGVLDRNAQGIGETAVRRLWEARPSPHYTPESLPIG